MHGSSNRRFWFLFSIADLIFITVLISILAGEGKLLADADVGLHIRAGEYILTNLAVPTHDIFSRAATPAAWTAHEWLAEVIFAALHKFFGLTGVAVFSAFLLAAVYAILFKFLRRFGVSIIVALGTALIAAGASAVHWLARPHIFSLVLLLVWYIILDTYQYKRRNVLYVLPLLMLLWVNLHGGFMMGFILLLAYIAGNFVESRIASRASPDAFGRAKVLAAFFVLCLLVSLVNPQGYKILSHPFKVATSGFATGNIAEWLSPNFHGFQVFELWILLLILTLGVSIRRLHVIEVILLLLLTHMSLFAARYIPLFGIIVSPILAKQADGVIEAGRGARGFGKIIATSDNMAAVDSMTKWHLWSVVAVVAVAVMCWSGTIGYRFDKRIMPVDAVQFARQERIEGKVFNSYLFGSYIIYAAWPEWEVFIDGREPLDGKDRIKEYLTVAGVQKGWRKILDRDGITWIMSASGSVLSNALLEAEDWCLIYADRVADIFVKRIPEHQRLIDRFPNVSPAAGCPRLPIGMFSDSRICDVGVCQ